MESIYGFLEIPFDPARSSELLEAARRSGRQSAGRHRYSLEQFGLSPASVNDLFGDYRARFDV